MKVWGFASFGEGIGFAFSNHFAPLSLLTAWKPLPQPIPSHPSIWFSPARGELGWGWVWAVSWGAPAWPLVGAVCASGGRADVGAGTKCLQTTPKPSGWCWAPQGLGKVTCRWRDPSRGKKLSTHLRDVLPLCQQLGNL